MSLTNEIRKLIHEKNGAEFKGSDIHKNCAKKAKWQNAMSTMANAGEIIKTDTLHGSGKRRLFYRATNKLKAYDEDEDLLTKRKLEPITDSALPGLKLVYPEYFKFKVPVSFIVKNTIMNYEIV
jgi:hypothetical protein